MLGRLIHICILMQLILQEQLILGRDINGSLVHAIISSNNMGFYFRRGGFRMSKLLHESLILMIKVVFHMLLNLTWLRSLGRLNRNLRLHHLLHAKYNLLLNSLLNGSLLIMSLFLFRLKKLFLGILEHLKRILVVQDRMREFVFVILISQKVLNSLGNMRMLEYLVYSWSSSGFSLKHRFQK